MRKSFFDGVRTREVSGITYSGSYSPDPKEDISPDGYCNPNRPIGTKWVYYNTRTGEIRIGGYTDPNLLYLLSVIVLGEL